MKTVFAAIVVCALAAACSYKSERTVVEQPAPASSASVVAPSGTTTSTTTVGIGR